MGLSFDTSVTSTPDGGVILIGNYRNGAAVVVDGEEIPASSKQLAFAGK